MEEIYMSTYMPKANEISRKWYVLDADGVALGRIAAKAAHILRGKHKPTYAPHADCGDHVIIINSDKAILTGKKLEQKLTVGTLAGLADLRKLSTTNLCLKLQTELSQLLLLECFQRTH